MTAPQLWGPLRPPGAAGRAPPTPHPKSPQCGCQVNAGSGASFSPEWALPDGSGATCPLRILTSKQDLNSLAERALPALKVTKNPKHQLG